MEQKFVVIKIGNCYEKIIIHEILYCKASGAYTKIKTDGKEYSEAKLLKKYEAKYISYTQLSRHIINVNSGYVPLKQFTPNQHDYFDHNLIPGKKFIYKVEHVTPTGGSNAKYDFVQFR